MPNDAPPRSRNPPGHRGSWQVASVAGIAIRVHWLMLLALPFFAYLMASEYFATNGNLTQASLAWGTGLAVVLFLSVTLHELAHSLMAKRFAIEVRSITLLPIGGVSQMAKIPREPRREFLISVVGPLTNFVIAIPILAWLHWSLFPQGEPGLKLFLHWVGITNLSLGAFNLLFPAFPMDGGRILRSLLARRMDYARATNVAATVGRVLAVAMGLVGAFGGGIFLLLIAFFIYAGAGEEARIVGIQEALGNVTLGQVMTPNPIAVSPFDTVDAVLQRMLETKHLGFPVMAQDKPIGYVGINEVSRVEAARRSSVQVGQVMRDAPPQANPETLATDALESLGPGGDVILVVEHDRIVGIVTRTDLARVVAILGVQRPSPGGHTH